jgi:ubiquitin carboxyl-terminal hydrolase 4/11/15
MDPQSAAFVPRDDVWKVQADLARIQQIQNTHAERLHRLEQRQDDDARAKSIWGPSSPFPSLMGGTPQQVPVQQPSVDTFSGFDDQPTHLIGSLHLDADEEPRRVGATSRANSVRFDETANQGHWSHTNRSSIDLLPRSGSSLGSHPLIERTLSHKSDGRQSSAGHSVHSMASRANSMGIDSLNALGVTSNEPPALTPGLFLLGSVPAIIRCWLTTKFKHESLLYAAICSGSFSSLISYDLVEALQFTERIRKEDDDTSKIKLSVYLPEASVRSASSRSSSPAHQLPNIAVDFTVVSDWDVQDKSIRIVIGSDVLRAHNADILFSSGTMTLYDDEKSKLSTPLVRPEDEATFKSLRTVGKTVTSRPSTADSNLGSSKAEKSPQLLAMASPKSDDASLASSSRPLLSQSTQNLPNLLTDSALNSPSNSQSRATPTSSPAIWGNWRRDSTEAKSDWNKTPAPQGYQRREQGIKILRPGASRLTNSSRSISTGSPIATTPPTGSIRLTDDAKRKVNGDDTAVKKLVGLKDGKSLSMNPAGEGSAFSWMNKS